MQCTTVCAFYAEKLWSKNDGMECVRRLYGSDAFRTKSSSNRVGPLDISETTHVAFIVLQKAFKFNTSCGGSVHYGPASRDCTADITVRRDAPLGYC